MVQIYSNDTSNHFGIADLGSLTIFLRNIFKFPLFMMLNILLQSRQILLDI